MLFIKNAQNPDGSVSDLKMNSLEEREIDASGLMAIPALIDPHVHFRTPGAEHKENWISGAQAAIYGGVTTVFDMPNNVPSCNTHIRLLSKIDLIQRQLETVGIPLRYYLYFGADRHCLKEIPKVKDDVIGIKVFMGSSTGDLLVDDDASLNEIFRIAADLDMIVSVHAEDETIIKKNKQLFAHQQEPAVHSKIRSREAAVKAVDKAISLAAQYGTRLCILHLSTKEEIALVKQAKAEGLQVFAETAPHHLFLSTQDYEQWSTRVQVNPPLREIDDQQALWQGINEGIIDFIGTDHAPHTLDEKALPYGQAPSGIPSIELTLSLLLNAVHEKRISLSTFLNITRRNIESIFRLPPQNDIVLVQMDQVRTIQDKELKTKCGWSPYHGWVVKGQPIFTIIHGHVFQVGH